MIKPFCKKWAGRFIAPAVRLMNALRYAQKFALISVLFAMPLSLVMYLLISEINARIDFSQKEMYGDDYLRPLRQLMEHVPQLRLHAYDYLSGETTAKDALEKKQRDIEKDLRLLEQAEDHYGTMMISHEGFDALKESWRHLKVQMFHDDKQTSMASHAKLIADVRALISRVGDSSNLILDPDLDSYYLMDAVLLKLPEAQDLLAQLQWLGIEAGKQKQLDPDQKAQLIVLSGLIRANLHTTETGFNTAFRNNPAKNLFARLEKPLEDYLVHTGRFLNWFEKESVRAQSQEADTVVLRQSAQQALSESFRLWDLAVASLDELLQVRIDGFARKKRLVQLVSCLMLAIVLYLLVAFYAAVKQTVSALEGAAQRMVQGDMEDVVLQTRDELGKVARSFNEIALRLRKEWKQAQEESARATAAEAELKSTRDIAVEASRAKSDFLATMSHEIRTPMNAIIGMGELLGESQLDEEQKNYVQTLTRSGENLLGLINDILDLSKVEAGKLEFEAIEFDLHEVLENGMELMALRAHQKGLELVQNIDDDVPVHVVGDPHRLRQVVLNLVGNAVKFTPHGEVVLSVTCARRPAEDAGETARLSFEVRDTGIGIPKAQAPLLFHPFTQVDSSTTRRFGGTGLGLAISKKLIECMGGTIRMESELGKGTTFYFDVEVTLPKNEAVRPKKIYTSLQGLRVLVVDDNATNRLVLREMLKSWQALVTEAASGQEGLEELRRFEPGHYQLILSDCRMPDLDGFEFAQKVKQVLNFTEMTIMMLTSDNRTGDIARAKSLGLDAYLVKPVKKDELYHAIQRALSGSAPVQAAAAPQAGPTGTDCKPMRILLVEDSEDNRLLIQSYLKKSPHHVDIAENGVQACTKVRQKEYDVVFMDLQMPEMDGYCATREIRSWEQSQNGPRRKPLPIIALSASGLKEEIELSLQSGCNEHLTKPIKKAVFLEAIERYWTAPVPVQKAG